VLVEAYNSIGKIERYYSFLRRVYKIIYDELRGTRTTIEIILQIAIKTINDLVGPDSIIPTLLVFGTYPRIADSSLLLLIVIKRAETIRKTIKEVRCLYAKRHIADTLIIRNGPNIAFVLKLPIQSNVKVWHENKR
jgi:hypothetical protein